MYAGTLHLLSEGEHQSCLGDALEYFTTQQAKLKSKE